MSTYILLMKLTDAGIRDIKSAPERIQTAIKTWEGMGGTMRGFYMTMGPYDYVAIGEAQTDAVAATFVLGLGSQGNVTTTTLKAFTLDEATAMVEFLD
jgi:uncharacterized protein with GYD domain